MKTFQKVSWEDIDEAAAAIVIIGMIIVTIISIYGAIYFASLMLLLTVSGMVLYHYIKYTNRQKTRGKVDG